MPSEDELREQAIKVDNLFDYTFVNGSYDDNTGNMTQGGDNRYVETIDYLSIPDDSSSISAISYDRNGNGLVWCAYLYDENKSYLYSESYSYGFLDWANNSTVRGLPSNAKFIRLMFRVDSSSRPPLAPTDIASAESRITYEYTPPPPPPPPPTSDYTNPNLNRLFPDSDTHYVPCKKYKAFISGVHSFKYIETDSGHDEDSDTDEIP